MKHFCRRILPILCLALILAADESRPAMADDPAEIRSAAARYPQALAALTRQADDALAQPPLSVTDKPQAGPSRDKHDYYSIAPYHWPNPKSADGLPYIQRDGEVNPAAGSDQFDRARYFAMSSAVQKLCLAYRVSGNAAYAEHAARLLRVWFLDPPTRMNPNLEYAQRITGQDKGNRSGIIRGTIIVELVEAAHWLDDSPHWSASDRAAWIAWQRDYLRWLRESELGKSESRAVNNHGTWYDVQVATLAVECGETDLARELLATVPQRRIQPQISAEGKQAHELLRTKSWDYSLFNLEAMFRLAELAEPLGIDLWNWKSDKSAGIRGALDYLVPFAVGEQSWKGKQIRDLELSNLYPPLIIAARAYHDPSCASAAAKIPGFDPARSVETLRLLAEGYTVAIQP